MTKTLAFTLAPADAGSFTGEAYTALLADSTASPPTRVYHVRFAPGARTHWHIHTGTQILLVQEGRCLLQREAGPIEEYGAGDVVRIEPGVRHWHGAAADAAMVHVAINLDNERTEWLEAADV